MSSISIRETDTAGNVTGSYVLTTSPPQTSESKNTHASTATRLDLVPSCTNQARSPSRNSIDPVTTPSLLLSTYIAPLFLPAGYPHTVTADYTAYQVYDSLQAFASAIIGLLSSRAVLQSLGVDTGDGSRTATYATLLSIAQSTISNLTTILFAHHASRRIATDVKFYRYLADITNDIAFVLECLSPSLPFSLRAPILCLSSASRAMCGVAGGSSKAVLSAHFAKNGNIGELNAKDGSQETLVNLVGMWVGGLVVSRVEGKLWTWVWVLALLGVHLWFNYCAVRSVRLTGLNAERAEIVLTELMRGNDCPGVELVGKEEGIFLENGLLQPRSSRKLRSMRMGVGLSQFAEALGGRRKAATGSIGIANQRLLRILDIFQDDLYLLWFDKSSREAIVLLKDKADIVTQARAWCHALHVSHSAREKVDPLEQISRSADDVSKKWPLYHEKLLETGWDLSSSVLEESTARRVILL